jgi:triacylglycerol lipase
MLFKMLPLLHTSQDFELQNALHLAELSQLAYHDGNFIQNAISFTYPSFEFIEVHPSSGYDTEAFIAANDQVIVVAFRGTEPHSLEDWVNNLDNRAFPYSTGNVHQGFWEALDVVWDMVLTKIHLFQHKNQTIWLTGHSQGGALASLAARRLLEKQIPIQGVYTYGQPKIGDMLFVANYDSFLKTKTFRLYNEDDSVVQNPPKLYHVGTGVKLFQNGGFEIQYQSNMFEFGGDSFTALLDSLFDFVTDKLKAHQIEEYIKRLQKSY